MLLSVANRHEEEEEEEETREKRRGEEVERKLDGEGGHLTAYYVISTPRSGNTGFSFDIFNIFDILGIFDVFRPFSITTISLHREIRLHFPSICLLLTRLDLTS